MVDEQIAGTIAAQVHELNYQHEVMASQIVKIGVALGIVRGDMDFTGPQVLHLAEDILAHVSMASSPGVI